jgi:hypothetical protein
MRRAVIARRLTFLVLCKSESNEATIALIANNGGIFDGIRNFHLELSSGN